MHSNNVPTANPVAPLDNQRPINAQNINVKNITKKPVNIGFNINNAPRNPNQIAINNSNPRNQMPIVINKPSSSTNTSVIIRPSNPTYVYTQRPTYIYGADCGYSWFNGKFI